MSLPLSTQASLNLAQDAYKKASVRFLSEPQRWETARQLIKTADFGENSNPQFEKAFGAIAFTYLQEKAPGLLPYVVGFQLIDRSEQGRKAIGAFTAKLGNRVIDIPMFFINGELKGHQFMRLRKPELFIPLREAFLDFLFSKLPQDLGDASGSLSVPSPVRATPNIQPFSGSRFNKNSEDIDHAHPWAIEAGTFEAYADMRLSLRTLKVGSELKHGRPLPGVNLLEIIGESEELLKTAARMADQYPEFAAGMSRRHGDDWMHKAASAIVASRVAPLPAISLPLAPGAPRIAVGAKLAIDRLFYRDKVATMATPERKEAMRAEIDRFGFFVDDHRSADKIAAAYEIEDQKLRIEPPNLPGVYRVAFAGDEVKEAIIFPSQYRIDDDKDLIIETGKKRFAFGERNSYIVSHIDSTEANRESKLDKLLTGKKRPSENEAFLVLLPQHRIAGPFVVSEKLGKDRYRVSSLCDCGSMRINEIEFRDTQRLGGHIVDGILIVPKTAKVLSLGSLKADEDGYVGYAERENLHVELLSSSRIELGNLSKYANLELLVKSGGQVDLNGKRMKLSHARKVLLQQCGMAKDAVDALLESPRPMRRFIVAKLGSEPSLAFEKFAAPYFTPAVDFPQEDQGYSSESGRYTIENPQTQYSSAEPEQRFQPTPVNEDVPGQMPGTVSGTNGGSNSGMVSQNETASLFDTSGLVSLVRNSRIDSQIRKTTQSLLRAIDELGTALFVFYAHNDEFESMYGEEAMEDLESAMISTFEGGGDLFITLSRRSADPHPELDIADLPHQ